MSYYNKEVVKMRSKTSIQAMYINRVKDLNSIYKDFANLIDRKISGEDVEELYSEISEKVLKLNTELELLKLVLDEDVPEVKSV